MVRTKVPYVRSLMSSFKHTLSIFMVGRESIRENWILLADTQEKHETGPGSILASGNLPGLDSSVSSPHGPALSPCAACQSCTVLPHALARLRRDTGERRDIGNPHTELTQWVVSFRQCDDLRATSMTTYKLPMKLKQINPLHLKSPTPLCNIRPNSFSGDRHRMEHAIFRCGEDVLPERVRCEESALRKVQCQLTPNDRTAVLLTARTSASP
jgi:hypothetical protein